jgi:hypothetical protein
MTRRPVKVVHSRANSAMVWLLPAPAGAISTVLAAAAASIITTASRCSPVSPVSPTAARACSSLTSCGTVRFAAARICCSVSRWGRVVYRSSFGGR